MTTEESIDDREVIFITQLVYDDYGEMPEEVQESADQAIDALQNNRPLPPKMFKTLTGNNKLSGIDEIRLPYDGDTYRVYVYRGCPYAVVILDAGEKKSPTGNKIPQEQVERLEARLKKAKDFCKAQGAQLKADYDKRRLRREAFEKRQREATRAKE